MEFYIHHKIWLYREGKRDCPKSRFCLISSEAENVGHSAYEYVRRLA